MKTLLRSSMVCAPADDRDLLMRNYLALADSRLGFDVVEDTTAWAFVQDFVRTHNHVPDITTVKAHFIRLGESEVVDRLGIVSSLPGVFRGDFIKRLEDKAHDRRVRQVQEVLRDAATVLTTGAEIRTGKDVKTIKGPIDAMRLIMDRSHDIVAPTLGTKLSGEITGDGADFADRYLRVKNDPLAGIGQHTGLQQIDIALKGAKKRELWIHAAYTGHGKSTFAFNWAYNQAVYYKHDVVIFSLEMYYEQVRNLLFAMHTFHEKFRDVRVALGLQTDPQVSVGLPYEAIRDGLLDEVHPRAEEFLLQHVVPDFNDESNGYGNIHIEVVDPDKTDFTVADMRAKAELLYSRNPFSLLFIDHISLMSPRKWVPSTTERLNEIIRDIKRLALSFNRGQGLAVVGLFQLSREGWRGAVKAKEKTGRPMYDLTNLSYSNESERSADVVTTTFTDEEFNKASRFWFQCLKSRDQRGFDSFLARIEWPCRRMLTCFDMPPPPPQQPVPGTHAPKQTPQQRAATAAKKKEDADVLDGLVK